LEVSFSTPDNAVGTFQIVALPGLGMTGWSDSNFNDRQFANVPFAAGESVPIAEVVVVPEPAGTVLALQMLVAAGILGWVRRRRMRGGGAVEFATHPMHINAQHKEER
jgi:hypothetical protein